MSTPLAPLLHAAPPLAAGYDLLRVRAVRALVHWRGFPVVIQVGLFALFIGLAVLAWGEFAPAGVNGKLFAKSHLATLLVWGLWWPAMVWGAVLLGRVWCTVCPLEWVSALGEKIVGAVGLPSRPLPRWLASGALIAGLYATIQLLVAGVHLHRVPAYTALFLTGLLSLALVTGLVWRNRAFCRGFCPVGLLLGTYGRGGMIAVRPGVAPPAPQPAVNARVCPSLLNPSRLASNADCLVCGQCFKAAAPGELQLVVRRPFVGTDRRELLAGWPVTAFVMVASGFVLSELCTEWPAAERVFQAAPHAVATWVGRPALAGWIEGVWTLGVVPVGLWSLLALTGRLTGAGGGFGEIWRRWALPMAVLISAGHMAKGLAKFVSWAPFLPHALSDPHGTKSALAITAKNVAAPAPVWPIGAVAVCGVGLVAAAFIFAVREHRLAARDAAIPAVGFRLPAALVAALFLGLVGGWAFR